MTRIPILKNGFCLSAFVLFLYLLILPIPAYTETFNVTNEDELREALRIAGSNVEDDVINIGAGIYRTFGEPFNYIDEGDWRGLTIQGEGKGLTILDGEESSKVLNIIRDASNPQNIFIIKNLIIQNGFTEQSFEDAGMSIKAFGQTVLVEDCEFINNKSDDEEGATSGAGGLSIQATDVSLKGNIFINNTGNSGGGCAIDGENINVTNNSFTDNVSEWTGGGLDIYGLNITLIDNIFTNNTAESEHSGSGGGASISGTSSVLISNNEFSNNVCRFSGGGLSVGGNLLITNNRFTENSAGFGGGGVSIDSGDEVNLSGNMFTGNSVFLMLTEPGIGGGGARINIGDTNETDVVFTNNILTHNTSTGDGGAFAVEFDDCINQPLVQSPPGPRTTTTPSCPPISEDNLVLTNNTFTLNSAELNGGAISITETITKDNITNVYNNIIYGNMGKGDGNDLYIKGGLVESDTMLKVNLFNNDFSDLFITCDGVVGCLPELNEGNNIDADPMFLDAEAGDFALMSDSACIDSGDPDAPDLPETDIYGNPRGPIPDMGAVEYIAAANNGGCSLTGSAAASSLSVFLALPVLMLIRRLVKRGRK